MTRRASRRPWTRPRNKTAGDEPPSTTSKTIRASASGRTPIGGTWSDFVRATQKTVDELDISGTPPTVHASESTSTTRLARLRASATLERLKPLIREQIAQHGNRVYRVENFRVVVFTTWPGLTRLANGLHLMGYHPWLPVWRLSFDMELLSEGTECRICGKPR